MATFNNNQNTSGVHVEGNITNGNVAGRDIHITNNGIPLEQLIELAKKLGVVESERDAWMQKYQDLEKQLANRTDDTAKQARAFLDKGDLEQAEKLFKQSLASKLTIVKEAAAEAFALAQIKELQLNQVEAKTYYQQATQLDPDNANYWNRLGVLLYRIGELNEATTAYEISLQLSENHQNQEGIAIACNNLGLIYQSRGALDKAVDFQKRALNINKDIKQRKFMIASYCNLGVFYQQQGKLDLSIEIHNKAIIISEQIGDREGLASNYGGLGVVFDNQGNVEKAIEMYLKSLSIAEERPKLKEICLNQYISLGKAYHTQEKLNEAIKQCLKALKISEYLGYREKTAFSSFNLGRVYHDKFRRGNEESDKIGAKYYYQKSLELFKDIGSPMVKTVQGWLDALQ